MAIVKILVDDCECEYITSIDNDFVEENNDIDSSIYDRNDDTIEIKNLFNNECKINESSEIDG